MLPVYCRRQKKMRLCMSSYSWRSHTSHNNRSMILYTTQENSVISPYLIACALCMSVIYRGAVVVQYHMYKVRFTHI